MSEERRQVLEMLASGKVTIEQANQLLDALGEEHVSEANDRATAEQHRDRRQPGLSPDLLVQLTAVSGDTAYIAQLRDLELTDLPRELLVQLTAVSGDAAYIRELRDSGLIEDLPHELLVQLTAMGANVGYIRELRDAGLVELSHAQLEDLKPRGVGAGSIQEVRGW